MSYYEKVLIPFVNDLVDSLGPEITFNELSPILKSRFANHMYRSDDCDLCSLYETIAPGMLQSAISAMLIEDDLKSGIRLSETIRVCMIDYYKKAMERMLSDTCTDRKSDIMYSSGFHKAIDPTTGEQYWSRA